MIPLYTHFCWECGSGVHQDYVPDEWDDYDPENTDLWGNFIWKCSNLRCSRNLGWKEIEGYMTIGGLSHVY